VGGACTLFNTGWPSTLPWPALKLTNLTITLLILVANPIPNTRLSCSALHLGPSPPASLPPYCHRCILDVFGILEGEYNRKKKCHLVPNGLQLEDPTHQSRMTSITTPGVSPSCTCIVRILHALW
jgi:hypothetical protein